MLKAIAVGALSLLVLGGVFGYRAGRWHEKHTWKQTLIEWGCAGYDSRTAEWVMTGAACQPLLMDAVEPEDKR